MHSACMHRSSECQLQRRLAAQCSLALCLTHFGTLTDPCERLLHAQLTLDLHRRTLERKRLCVAIRDQRACASHPHEEPELRPGLPTSTCAIARWNWRICGLAATPVIDEPHPRSMWPIHAYRRARKNEP